LNIVITFTKYLAENWKRTQICIKVLFIGIFASALLAILNYLNLYLYINSGGLHFPSGIGCNIYIGCLGILLCLYLLAAICLIFSFFKAPRITNLILSVIGAILVFSIHYMCSVPRISGFFGQPDKDIMRYYAHNEEAIEKLNEFGQKIRLLNTDEKFIFTEQSVKDLSDSNHLSNERYHYIFDPDFDFNKNLLGFKPDQINKDAVLLFQSKNDSSQFSGADDISAEWHYDRGSLIVFGDGRIEFVKKENFKNLRWQP